MPAALIAALFFTVALLVTTAYFLLGSIPLLVLEHDTPLDGRFVRGFFNIYYRAATVTSGGAAVSYAFAGNPGFALGAGALTALAIVLRGRIIPRMDALRSRIEGVGDEAVRSFRRTHVTAIVLNIVQLALIVWSLVAYPVR